MDSNNPNRKVNEFKCILLNKVSYVTESVKGRRNLTPGEFGYENIENHLSRFSPRPPCIFTDPLTIQIPHHTASLSGQWCLPRMMTITQFQIADPDLQKCPFLACCHLFRLLTLGIISAVEFAAAALPPESSHSLTSFLLLRCSLWGFMPVQVAQCQLDIMHGGWSPQPLKWP